MTTISRVDRHPRPRGSRGFADGFAQRRVRVGASGDVLGAAVVLHDRHALGDQFRRPRAEDVDAQHAVGLRVGQHLHPAVGFVHRFRPRDGRELELADAVLDSLLLQLLLRLPHARDFRPDVDDARDRVVVHVRLHARERLHPRTLIIDNLRAAVTRADWYDPELNAKVEEFCRHYGTVMLPTRPAMPRHKGKIEAGVKYAQNNALKGRSFESLAAQNLFLSDWESGVADTRIHGTTRQQVGKVFNEVERAKLLPLPASLFPVFEEAPRTVHRDGYVELQRAYYSVPPEYVGRQVWVRWESRLLRVFNQRREVIAVHALAEPGKFTTDPTHLHSPYRRVVQQSLDYLLDRARLIGMHTGSWAEAMVQQRGPIGTRVLHGLLSLAGKSIRSKHWKRAPQKALHHGTWRLRDLRTLLEQAGPSPQLDFLETHPLIRILDTYRALAPDCFNPQPPTPL